MHKSVHRDLKSPNILLEKIVGETVTIFSSSQILVSKIFIRVRDISASQGNQEKQMQSGYIEKYDTEGFHGNISLDGT